MSAAIRVASFIGLMLVSMQSWAEYHLNLRPGVTSFSQGAYDIHTLVMWICVVIGIVVFGAMIYSIVMHRKSRGAVAAKFDDNLTIEIVWTVIPFIILGFMAVPATKVLLAMEDVSDSDMSIKVTGYQWKWHYDYNVGENAQDISFFSNLATPMEEIHNKATKEKNYLLEVDNRIVVPANKKIRLLFTSNDVIHAWWIPAFGVKQDAIPGYINDAWFKTDKIGTYRGQCAELCGTNHGFMPIVVDVVSEADYEKWVASKKESAAAAEASSNKTWTKAELIEHGKAVYATNCVACHQASGEGIPNVFPALKGSAIATGDVSKHIDIVVHGKTGTAMQAFGAQLNDADLAALVTYERNAWGNDTGDAVQPADIKAAR
ncbi:MAG TPA: cytochrome c oxidase subunit II [Gammaproteobacteria bacterium]|nr:cytochrome c oxidase subunit II [Gammaproteobacteria bacterium]